MTKKIKSTKNDVLKYPQMAKLTNIRWFMTEATKQRKNKLIRKLYSLVIRILQ